KDPYYFTDNLGRFSGIASNMTSYPIGTAKADAINNYVSYYASTID
ncbi:9415_t:CDS:1, partial [Cetraspora pellucida]